MSGLSPQGFEPGDPGLFLHDIDLGSGQGGFVRADRATLSAEPFLDHRWRGAEQVDVVRTLAELPATGPEPPRLSFIWHTSFCASTLLSACLDSPGRCLTLKEPRILVILADLKRSGQLGRADGLAKSVFSLLGRRFDPDERILVKPSNGANGLLPEAAALTRGRMLLLYSDCETFVLSMARQGAAGFAYVRDLFRSLLADGHPVSRWPAAELLRLTDLQLAALVWRMQMDVLEAASARLGDRARSLDCRLFLEDPGLTLRRVDDFLELDLGAERLDAVITGPLLTRDAKRPGQAFDAQARAEAQAKLRAQLGPDLPLVLRSMEAVFQRPPRLAPPLAPPPRSAAAPTATASRSPAPEKESPDDAGSPVPAAIDGWTSAAI
jgi:hypothetical protein